MIENALTLAKHRKRKWVTRVPKVPSLVNLARLELRLSLLKRCECPTSRNTDKVYPHYSPIFTSRNSDPLPHIGHFRELGTFWLNII